MRDLEFEKRIGEERCCGVTIQEMADMFDKVVATEGYLPSSAKKQLSPGSDFYESSSFTTLHSLFLFSAMVVLRKANGLSIPEDLDA